MCIRDRLDGVVNIVTGEHDVGESGGNDTIPLLTRPDGQAISYPLSLTMSPGLNSWLFYLDTETWDWVQNWDVTVTGISKDDVEILGQQTSITLVIENDTDINKSFQITDVTGDRFRTANVRKIVRRIGDSIAVFGEREFRYPSRAVWRVDKVIDAVNFTLEFTDGISSKSAVSLPHYNFQIRALHNDIPYYDVGDLILYNGVIGFVDHVKYAIDAQGYADITLGVVRNERGRAFNLAKTNWGESQVIGA